MPDPFEFPRMLGAVVPHMGRERFARFRRNVVSEFVALPFRHSVGCRGRLARSEPRLKERFPAVIGPLNDLSKPTAGLRNVNPVRIHRRPFRMINLPASEMWSVDLPVFPLPIRGQNKRTFPRPDQNSYSAHRFILPFVIVLPLLLACRAGAQRRRVIAIDFSEILNRGSASAK